MAEPELAEGYERVVLMQRIDPAVAADGYGWAEFEAIVRRRDSTYWPFGDKAPAECWEPAEKFAECGTCGRSKADCATRSPPCWIPAEVAKIAPERGCETCGTVAEPGGCRPTGGPKCLESTGWHKWTPKEPAPAPEPDQPKPKYQKGQEVEEVDGGRHFRIVGMHREQATWCYRLTDGYSAFEHAIKPAGPQLTAFQKHLTLRQNVQVREIPVDTQGTPYPPGKCDGPIAGQVYTIARLNEDGGPNHPLAEFREHGVSEWVHNLEEPGSV